MKRSSASSYNQLTVVFLVLTLFAFLCMVGMLARIVKPPGFLEPVAIAAVPTHLVPPTDTPTFTPSATFTPTETFTPTFTPTLTPPPTLTFTATSPATSTPPVSAVPPTAAATDAPPTVAATSAQYPFILAATFPQAIANPDTATACKLQAIAGQILGTDGKPITSKVQVFINGSGIKKLAKPAAGKTAYGDEGYWALTVGNKVNTNTYTVEVLNNKGDQISDPVDVAFTADCAKNVILVTFSQIAPIALP